MKKAILFLFPVLLFADTQVRARGPYVTLGTNLAWGGAANGTWIFTPHGPDVGVCVAITNRNPTTAKTVSVVVRQSADPSVRDYSNNTGRWVTTPIIGSATSVNANSTQTWFSQVAAAAKVAVSVSGSSAGGGSPDVGDFYVVQTTAGGCVGTPIPVQGAYAEGATVGDLQPVLVGGLAAEGFATARTITAARAESGRTYLYVTGSGSCTPLSDVPTSSSTALEDDRIVTLIWLHNTSASDRTVTMTDGQATPKQALKVVLASEQTLVIDVKGVRFDGSVNWVASATGVVGCVCAL